MTKDKVIRMYDLYLEGKSHQTIANIYNQEKVLGKTNWKDSTIGKIMTNELYKGDYLHGKKTKNPTYYENVVEPIISKKLWEECQEQTRKNIESIKCFINPFYELNFQVKWSNYPYQKNKN